MSSSGQADARPDESEEVARLRAEVARLRQAQEPTDRERRGWWRPVVAGLLVALAAVLAPLSVLATWASGQIEDTDRYLETVAPLAQDPDVQAAIARRIEEVVFDYLDVDAVTDQLVEALSERGLPTGAQALLRGLARPLADGVEGFVRDKIDAFVRSEAFEQAWVEANRAAHTELAAALGGGPGSASRTTVSVPLATIINAVKRELVSAGFGIAERIPEVTASFTLIRSDRLSSVQHLLGLIDGLSLWLPVLGVALIGTAVVIARDRRRTVLAAGLGVAASMLLLGMALNVVRPFYLRALPESTSVAAAGAVFDHLVSFIRVALRSVLVVALAAALAAWLSAGRGAGAVARAGMAGVIRRLREGGARAGLRTGRFGLVLGQFRAAIRVTVVGVAALAYVAQDHPTGRTALTFVALTALVLFLLEVVAVPPPQEAQPESATSG